MRKGSCSVNSEALFKCSTFVKIWRNMSEEVGSSVLFHCCGKLAHRIRSLLTAAKTCWSWSRDRLSFDCECAWQTYQWAMCLDEMLTVYLHRGSCDIIKEWKACWRCKLLWRIWLPCICVVDCSGMVKIWYKHEQKSSWLLIIQYLRDGWNLSNDGVQPLACTDKETEIQKLIN